jgi:hypothetical protein
VPDPNRCPKNLNWREPVPRSYYDESFLLAQFANFVYADANSLADAPFAGSGYVNIQTGTRWTFDSNHDVIDNAPMKGSAYCSFAPRKKTSSSPSGARSTGMIGARIYKSSSIPGPIGLVKHMENRSVIRS